MGYYSWDILSKKKLNFSHLWIESDSKVVIKLLNKNLKMMPLFPLIEFYRSSHNMYVRFGHVYHEANLYADVLAKQALSSKNGLLFFEKIPLFVSATFGADFSFVSFDHRVGIG